MKVCSNISRETLERFVRQIETDKVGKLSYIDFVASLQKIGTKNHNPFRSLVNRINYFLNHNAISVGDLLKRLSKHGGAVPVTDFAAFLKAKVDKKRDGQELLKFARMLDVDKDGMVGETDVTTCVKNLGNAQFWRDNGASLSRAQFGTSTKFFPQANRMSNDKAREVIKQINDSLSRQKITYRDCFTKLDANRDDMVSYAEFSTGLSTVVGLAPLVLEQIYALMDKQSVGLINYSQFLDVLKRMQIDARSMNDNFDWEQSTIAKIRAWIVAKRCTVEEAHKCFDIDFDGVINKADLKSALTNLL